MKETELRINADGEDSDWGFELFFGCGRLQDWEAMRVVCFCERRDHEEASRRDGGAAYRGGGAFDGDRVGKNKPLMNADGENENGQAFHDFEKNVREKGGGLW